MMINNIKDWWYRVSRYGKLKKIRDMYWWIRHRTINRYHVLDLKIEPGWHDVDYRMLHACFRLLELYVEKEQGGPSELREWIETMRNLSGDLWEIGLLSDQIKREEHVLDLYYWWQGRKKSDMYPDEWWEEDTEKLKELIEIRGTLWT